MRRSLMFLVVSLGLLYQNQVDGHPRQLTGEAERLGLYRTIVGNHMMPSPPRTTNSFPLLCFSFFPQLVV
jgi:hypothetical protein